MNRSINRLLWLGGTPAAYMRRFHALIDNIDDINVRYIFLPFKASLQQQRSYEVGQLSARSIVYDRSTKKRCMALIRDYANDPQAGILFCGLYPRQLMWLGLQLRNSACVKLFYSDTNIASLSPFSLARTIVYRSILKHFHTFLVIGSYNVLFIRQVLSHSCFQTKRIVHFPYPHDHSEFANNNKRFEPDKPLSFLYLGRLSKEKNVASLCHACRILVDEGHTRFSLTIAGDGPEFKAISEIVNANSLSAIVSFPGFIMSKDAPEVFRRHDVFILPSLYEPWGVVVNEALSSGLPVIAPIWAGAAADLIINGHNGIRLNSVTPESIAEAMKFYIRHPERIAAESANAMRQVLLSKADITEALENLKSVFGIQKP